MDSAFRERVGAVVYETDEVLMRAQGCSPEASWAWFEPRDAWVLTRPKPKVGR